MHWMCLAELGTTGQPCSDPTTNALPSDTQCAYVFSSTACPCVLTALLAHVFLLSSCPCSVGEGRVHACLREHRKEISDGCRREEMILEQQEAEHIELRPNLLQACSNERQTFCGNVQPGSARVFRCVHVLGGRAACKV